MLAIKQRWKQLAAGLSSALLLYAVPAVYPGGGGRGRVPLRAGSDNDHLKAASGLPCRLIRVPLCRQSTDYTCGVAALQSILMYYGDERREDSLARELKANTEDGTSYKEIERFAGEHGFDVDEHRNMTINDLEGLLARKLPVLVLLQAWRDQKVDYSCDWNDGHYAVAIGCDKTNIYFMDPSTLGCYTYIPKSEFKERWHDVDGDEHLYHFGVVISRNTQPYDQNEIKHME